MVILVSRHPVKGIYRLLRDPRNPLQLAGHLRRHLTARGRRSAPPRRPGAPLRVALTFDVEHEFGHPSTRGRHDSVGPFLDTVGEVLAEIGATATFFVQGTLIESFAARFQALSAAGHELGVHGWNHESWGFEWFLDQPPPRLDERVILLERALEAFKTAGLPRPISFRAPYMVADEDTLTLLSEHGFRVDSSHPSFQRPVSGPYEISGQIEIPVSADPKLSLSWRGAQYSVMNTHTVATSTEEAWLASVNRVIDAQAVNEDTPFLVCLAHPWEFFAHETGPFDVGYCSPDNFALWRERLARLSEVYDVTYSTLSGLINRG